MCYLSYLEKEITFSYDKHVNINWQYLTNGIMLGHPLQYFRIIVNSFQVYFCGNLLFSQRGCNSFKCLSFCSSVVQF